MQNRRSWKETSSPSSITGARDTVKTQLRVTTSSEDSLIDIYIDAAVQIIEAHCGRAILQRSFILTLDEFPDCSEIELVNPPFVSLTYLKYIATDGTLTTWASSNYDVDSTSLVPRVVKKYWTAWPTTDPGVPNAVQVTFLAGYGGAFSAVPAALRAAIFYLVSQMYENRTPVEVGVTANPVPMTYHLALDPYRVPNV